MHLPTLQAKLVITLMTTLAMQNVTMVAAQFVKYLVTFMTMIPIQIVTNVAQ